MPRNRETQEGNLRDKTAVEIRQIARDNGIHDADRYEKHELLDKLGAEGGATSAPDADPAGNQPPEGEQQTDE